MEILHTNDLKVQTINSNLGIAILNLDPNRNIDHQTAREIEILINRYHLVLMKSDTPIKKETQVDLTKRLGEPWRYDYVPGQYRDYPEIFKVTNQKGDGFANAGQAWHSDGSIYNKRMHLSIFSIDKIPVDGASTYFSNLNYAYDRLPENIKQKLLTLEGNFGKMYRPHPVVWKHPITQMDLLHISEGFKDGFIDTSSGHALSFDESQEIHKLLNDHMWEENTYYEHKWKLGDLVIADNYAVAHFAKPNYSNTLRVLHRTATKGEKRAKHS